MKNHLSSAAMPSRFVALFGSIALLSGLTVSTPASASYQEWVMKPADVYPLTGWTAALSGDHLAIPIYRGQNRYQVRVYHHQANGNWDWIQSLASNDDEGWPDEDVPPEFEGGGYDEFGEDLAADPYWLFVSDPDGGNALYHGRVYVYRRTEEPGFVLAQVLDSPGITPGSVGFGSKMAVSGNTAAVADTEQLWVYRYLAVEQRNGTYAFQWALDTALSLPRTVDHFSSLAISDGRILVGSVVIEELGEPCAAYVFDRISGHWQITATLTSGDGVIGNDFGRSVAFQYDVAVVGAPHTKAYVTYGMPFGTVYIFAEDSNAGWTQTAAINPPDIVTMGWGFGNAVGISGLRLAIGDDSHLPHAAIHLYALDLWQGGWDLTDTLGANHPVWNSGLGNELYLDGERVVAPEEGGYTGNVHVFEPGPEPGFHP